MSFTALFSLQTALCMAVGYAWFLLPGWLVQRLLPPGYAGSLGGLLAPLLGMACFGPPSALFFNAARYDVYGLIAFYAIFNLALWLLSTSRDASAPAERSSVGARRNERWLVGASCALAFVPCLASFPFVHDGALYTGGAIHDHSRVTFVDALVRHGLPPVNSLFAPGHDVPLNYYYLWIFLASQLRQLTGMPGWPAELALTWLTFLAVLTGCAGIARELGKTHVASWAAIALLMCGPLGAAVPGLREGGWLPPNMLATAIVQAAWSPHHLMAAGVIACALFLFSRACLASDASWRFACVLGCLLASVFECSMWLAFALTVSAPLLALALCFCYRRELGALRGIGLLLLRASLVTVLLSLVVLSAAIAGPYAYQGKAVALILQRAVSWSQSGALQLVLYWTYAVPIAYGAACVLGTIGLARALRRGGPTHLFALLSCAAVVGFLLVTQTIRSIVMNNDLGWRAHIVAYLLLSIWGAQSLDELARMNSDASAGSRWRGARGLMWSLAAGAILAGLYVATPRLPGPQAADSSDLREERARFLVQARAWDLVRRHASRDELVQSNPYAFTRLSPFPVNLSFTLFADRRSVYAHPNLIHTYSHGMGSELLRGLHLIVMNAFSEQPNPNLLKLLRDGLHVKALLVDRKDPVWRGDGLERSKVYARVHAEEFFRVYVATKAVIPDGLTLNERRVERGVLRASSRSRPRRNPRASRRRRRGEIAAGRAQSEIRAPRARPARKTTAVRCRPDARRAEHAPSCRPPAARTPAAAPRTSAARPRRSPCR
jgi:hypothetical protein